MSSSAVLLAPRGGSSWTETTNSLVAQHPREPGLLADRLRRDQELSLADDEGERRLPALVDRAADGRDLRGRRAAAAADQPGAEAARLGRELAEVLRRRVREDDARAREAGEADVGKRSEHETVALHFRERVQRRRRTRTVVRPDRREPELAEAVGRVRCRDAAERLPVGVERHQRDERQARHTAHGLDRDEELLQVVERLQHQQVDAAALQHPGLLDEQRGRLGGVEQLRLAEGADRAGDEDLAARHLARLPREPDAGRVDLLQLLLEVERRQLAAIRPERVRLDQVGAGANEARVERDDALRRAQVRLLGAPQPRHRAGDERSHAAVGDEGDAARQPFLEPRRHSANSRWVVPVGGEANEVLRSTPFEGRVNSQRVIPPPLAEAILGTSSERLYAAEAARKSFPAPASQEPLANGAWRRAPFLFLSCSGAGSFGSRLRSRFAAASARRSLKLCSATRGLSFREGLGPGELQHEGRSLVVCGVQVEARAHAPRELA